MLFRLYGSSMDLRLVHLLNALCPISSVVYGMSIDVRFVQPERSPDFISVMPIGNFMDLRLLHPKKALRPIFCTLSGMLSDFRDRQKMNASSPMDLSLAGSTISSMSYR